MSTDHEYAYLTTTGRVTGRSHTVEIWYRRMGDVVWFISGGMDAADWVRNLLADPAVSVRIGHEELAGQASVDEQDAIEPRRALAARYQGWREGEPLSDWATRGLLVAVRVVQPRSAS